MSQQPQQEDHFFIRFIQNKLRSINKKLKQIEQLETQKETLNADQEKKIAGKNDILEQINHYKQMLVAYQNAEKEFGIKRTEGKKQQKLERFREEGKVITDTISFMMELQYLSQYFSKGPISTELQQHKDQINQIKSLYDSCFRLSGDKKQKLIEKLEQAKNIMFDVMYQKKEFKGITTNVKMLIKKDCVCNSFVGGKEKKPSRKVSSAVQRKMSHNKQEEKKIEIKEKEQTKQSQQQQQQQPQPQQQQQQQQPVAVEEKQEKKYVLTKIEPSEGITRNRSQSNKEKQKELPKQEKKENFKQPRKVTFDETQQQKTDGFIEVKPRAQKKQDEGRKFERKRGQGGFGGQKFQKRKDFGINRERPATAKRQQQQQQQVVQYVKKEQPQEEKKQE